MDYHSDRFKDASFLIFKNTKLIGLFPANRLGNRLYSHQGLTYGGLLLSKTSKLKDVIQGFKTLLSTLYTLGYTQIQLKDIPSIYHQMPSDELKYLMFVLEAKLVQRDALSVVTLAAKNSFSKDRIQGINRSKNYALTIKEVFTFDAFWNTILIPNLLKKHKVSPVHSLDEITKLKQRFPDNIRQFNVYYKNTIVAGTTIFETETVAHSQYISANQDKNKLGSLDALHDYLLKEVFADKLYFDFGISSSNKNKNINQGLQYWKEGFGARTITQDFYEIEVARFRKLNSAVL